MILSSKAISVHICSKLCMVAFLSSISARYFHTIGVSSMFDAHFWCKYQHAPKDRKVTRHINVLFISKCIFPPFLQHTRKDRKIRPGPPVSRRRTFLSFPGLLYIHTYTHTHIHTYTHAHMHTCTHAHMHTYTHIHTYIPYNFTYLHTYIFTYIYTYIHTYVRTYIHTYLLTYLHTYIFTYLHTYILTYWHTYILTYLHTYILTYIYIYINAYIGIHIQTQWCCNYCIGDVKWSETCMLSWRPFRDTGRKHGNNCIQQFAPWEPRTLKSTTGAPSSSWVDCIAISAVFLLFLLFLLGVDWPHRTEF